MTDAEEGTHVFSMSWTALTMMMLQAAVPVVTMVAVLVIAVTVRRDNPLRVAPTDRPGILEQRLEHLDRLLAAGRITEPEHRDARARLLGTL
ncbi:hypothetical protein GCM10023216_00820 [Isoptericola chiayiensis]|uniref:SHOCT domain-containing protein n=2 Tax=Isoptericola chiayiensis TaxID=579446 RepID=A0ABP8XY81_9MICO